MIPESLGYIRQHPQIRGITFPVIWCTSGMIAWILSGDHHIGYSTGTILSIATLPAWIIARERGKHLAKKEKKHTTG